MQAVSDGKFRRKISDGFFRRKSYIFRWNLQRCQAVANNLSLNWHNLVVTKQGPLSLLPKCNVISRAQFLGLELIKICPNVLKIMHSAM
jgi:hypothetical protein